MINMRSSRAVSDNDSSQGFHTQGCLGHHSLPNLLSGLLILTPNLTPPCHVLLFITSSHPPLAGFHPSLPSR